MVTDCLITTLPKPTIWVCSTFKKKLALKLYNNNKAKTAVVRKFGADVLYGYFVKKLSLFLQKGMASSINGRLHKLNSYSGSLDAVLTWRHENVAEGGQYRA